jgi:hypothetical protein
LECSLQFLLCRNSGACVVAANHEGLSIASEFLLSPQLFYRCDLFDIQSTSRWTDELRVGRGRDEVLAVSLATCT